LSERGFGKMIRIKKMIKEKTNPNPNPNPNPIIPKILPNPRSDNS
jgi:hypothetical protein